MRVATKAAMLGALLALGACDDKDADKAESSRSMDSQAGSSDTYSLVPTGSSPTDPRFQQSILSDHPRSYEIVQKAREIEKQLRPSIPIRGEFETTEDYERRKSLIKPSKDGLAKYYAIVRECDFSYNADTQTMKFGYKSGASLHTSYEKPSFELLRIENITIDSPLTPPIPTLHIAPNDASTFLSKHLECALVIKFMEDDIVEDGDLDDDTLAEANDSALAMSDESRWTRSWHKVRNTPITVKAKAVRFFVFEADPDAAPKILSDWVAD